MPSLVPSAPGRCPAQGGLGAAWGGTPQLESRVDRFDLISEDRATSHEDPMNEKTLPASQGTQLSNSSPPHLLIPLARSSGRLEYAMVNGYPLQYS